MSATHDISHIRALFAAIERGQKIIDSLYVYRGIAPVLPKVVEVSTQSQDVKDAVMPAYQKLLDLADEQKRFCDDSIALIVRLLNFDFWGKGHYSDELVDKVCECFFVMASIDEMRTVKTSFTNDYSFLRKLIGGQKNEKDMELSAFFASGNYCQHKLVTEVNKMKTADRQTISNIFCTRIKTAIETHAYLRPEMFYAFVRTLVLFIAINPPESDIASFIHKLAEEHPIFPMAYEVSFDLEYAASSVRQKSGKSSSKSVSKAIDPLANMTKDVSGLPDRINDAKAGRLAPEDFYKELVAVIKDVGDVKNYVREQLAMKLSKPPPQEEGKPEMSKFERSVRMGYTDDEIRTLLRLLMSWRTVTDTLRDNAEFIMGYICPYMYQSFQRFVKEKCESMLKDVQKKRRSQLGEIIMPLQEVLGDWEPGEERIRQKPTKRTIKPNKASPSPSAIEFLRIQMEHIFKTKKIPVGFKHLDKGSQDDVKRFLAESESWAEFLNFGAVVASIADQSDLFFKEVQHDINKDDLAKQNIPNFPVRASLPFVLGEYALKNFFLPELTEYLFYPLGIYDDAAHVAQFRLKSRFLLDEIKAEAKTCIHTLSIMISEFTFGSFRAHASMRFLSDTVCNALKGQLVQSHKWVDSSAYRLSALLNQNQFYLHCQQIDVKSLIADKIEQQMIQAIGRLIQLPMSIGLWTMVAVSTGLDIICETHRTLTEHGFAMMPFDTMLKAAMGVTDPTTFSSKFVEHVVTSIRRVVINWYFRSNPMRFIPIQKKSLRAHAFGKGGLGETVVGLLEPVANIITVEHFCCFTRLIDDGSVVSAVSMLVSDFSSLFTKFVDAYEALQKENFLKRVADPPLSASGRLAFDRFEGAYMFLGAKEQIRTLYSLMGRLGNYLGIVHMFDIAFNSKKMTRAQITAYLKGINLDLQYNSELASLVGKELADKFEKEDPIPTDCDVYPYVLSLCLSTVIRTVTGDRKAVFEETSRTILDLTSLTGFGATWSVLEYLFVMLEAFRDNTKLTNPSPFEIYGEGVVLCAAATISALGHERLAFATNIGRRLQRMRGVDYSASLDDRLERFCVCETYESSCLQRALAVYRPIISHLKATGLLQL